MTHFRDHNLLKEPPSTPDVQWPRWCGVLVALATLGFALVSLFSKKWLYSFPTTMSYGTNYTWGPVGFCYTSGALNSSACFMGYGNSFGDWPGTVWQLTLVALLLAILSTLLAAVAGMAGLCQMCRRPDWHAAMLAGAAVLLFALTVFMFPAGFGATVHVTEADGVRVCTFGATYSLGGGCALEIGYKLLLMTTCLAGLMLSLFLAADKMVVIRTAKRRYALVYQGSIGSTLPSDPIGRQWYPNTQSTAPLAC